MPDANLPPEEKIVPALAHHYTIEPPEGVVSDRPRLIEMLRKLPALAVEDHVDTVAVLLRKHDPASVFSQEDQAIIAFVDDATTQVLSQTDLDFKTESYVRDIAPFVAALALEKGFKAITDANQLFNLIDLLIRELIGWSEDLGILGQQFIDKMEVPIKAHSGNKLDAKACIQAIQKIQKKEEPLFKKLETRLVDRERSVLSGLKANYYSTELINREMTGKQLSLFMIFMLQGPWFEFLQNVYVQYGEKSKEWQNVQKLTEALIWSLQPGIDRTKQQSVMKSVPAKVRALCKAAPFDTEQVRNSLADLQGEYEAILANEPSDPCDFELLEVDQDLANAMQAIASEAVKQIRDVELGQWYLYDDPAEPDEKVARIKLILNWQDTEQLLLTNHNRRKVVHMSYSQMINHLKSGVLKMLNPKQPAADTFRAHLFHVLKAVSDQNKKEKQIEVREERRAVSVEYSEQRKEDLEKQLAVLEQQAEKKRQRALVLRHKAQKKQEAAESTVTALKQDAWVKLPIMEGTLTPCRLVAIIPGNDTYIFANRAGLKVAEYTGSQLAHMIVTENSEILDTGAEFESALATVVTGLREDRNKSYEELTGDAS